MTIYLVGYMGSGKSTMGRRLAASLGYDFADTDIKIESSEGATIADIFADKGEDYFRTKERECIENLAEQGDTVIATGGGLPCKGENMALMNSRGVTIYLKMTPEKLFTRLENGRHKRPLIKDLSDEQLLAFIAKNVEARESYYAQAKIVIDCDGRSDSYIIKHIEQALELTIKS